MTNKTAPNNESVEDYINSIEDVRRQADARKMQGIMSRVTGEKPVMWGSSIVGFGLLHYKYATGREGDTLVVGFSARKTSLTLYGVVYYDQNLEAAQMLGDIKVGKGCLYIKKLDDINLGLLEDMIDKAYKNRNNLFDK